MKKILLILLALFCASPEFIPHTQEAVAAVAYDASASQPTPTDLSNVSLAINASGANRLLTVGVGFDTDCTVSGVTHNGVAMTRSPLGQIDRNVYAIDVWYLIAPATGSQTVAATTTGCSTFLFMSAVSFTGVHQVNSLGTGASYEDTTDPMTATITVPANGMGVAFFINNEEGGTFTPGAGQTEPFVDFADAGGNARGMASYTTTTGSVAMTFSNSTGNYGAGIAYPINEAAAGAPAVSAFEPIEM